MVLLKTLSSFQDSRFDMERKMHGLIVPAYEIKRRGIIVDNKDTEGGLWWPIIIMVLFQKMEKNKETNHGEYLQNIMGKVFTFHSGCSISRATDNSAYN